MRYATVCSGIECMTLAARGLDWSPVFFSENAPFPSALLNHHYPTVPNLGDMTQIKGTPYHGKIDLLAGGTPCQGFSVSGRRGGLRDPRSQLCLDFVRLCGEIQPQWLLWENVPGCLSTNKGQDFALFALALQRLGYSLAWRILDCQYTRVDIFGRAIPQRRRRVWLVGYLGTDELAPAKILFEPESLRGSAPPRRDAGQCLPARLETTLIHVVEAF